MSEGIYVVPLVHRNEPSRPNHHDVAVFSLSDRLSIRFREASRILVASRVFVVDAHRWQARAHAIVADRLDQGTVVVEPPCLGMGRSQGSACRAVCRVLRCCDTSYDVYRTFCANSRARIVRRLRWSRIRSESCEPTNGNRLLRRAASVRGKRPRRTNATRRSCPSPDLGRARNVRRQTLARKRRHRHRRNSLPRRVHRG